MKFFITIAISVLLAHEGRTADLPDFSGTLNFSEGQLKIVTIQHHISVAVRNDQGRAYVTSLKADGFTCELKPASMYACRKTDLKLNEDPVLRADLVSEFSELALNFETTDSSWDQVNDAPELKEYERLQNSSFGSSRFSKVHVYRLGSGLLKLKLYSHEQSEAAYFYLNGSGNVAQQIRAKKSLPKSAPYVIDHSAVYLYEAVWEVSGR